MKYARLRHLWGEQSKGQHNGSLRNLWHVLPCSVCFFQHEQAGYVVHCSDGWVKAYNVPRINLCAVQLWQQ